MRPDPARKGVVLLAALMVLGLVGTLLVAGYFSQRERWAVRLVAGRSAQLRAAADGAVVDAAMQWDSAARFRQLPGSTTILSGPWPGTEWAIAGRVTRLSTWAYRVAARATDRADTALGAWSAGLVLVDAPRFASLGALVARGEVHVGGSLVVAGADSTASVECQAPAGWFGGIVVAPGGVAPAGARVDPAAADDSTYSLFGGVTRDDLVARADRVLPPGSVIAVPSGNVIHAAGDLELTGGSGAGLLLVDGALRISGNATFRGVIVASGGLTVVAGSFTSVGLLRSGGGEPAVDVNTPAVMNLQFDACVIQNTEWHAGRVKFAELGSADTGG